MTGTGNLIAGNTLKGLLIGSGSTGNCVQGNAIGTDRSGIHALGNGFGIEIGAAAPDNTIGGTAARAGNVISGNSLAGLSIYATRTVVQRAADSQTYGAFYVAYSSGLPGLVLPFGNTTDTMIPVAGDFDGDGRTDLAADSPTYGAFYIAYSTGKPGLVIPFGDTTDPMIPVAGDFNGDGQSDPALFDQATGAYKVARSGGAPEVLDFGNGAARLMPFTGVSGGENRVRALSTLGGPGEVTGLSPLIAVVPPLAGTTRPVVPAAIPTSSEAVDPSGMRVNLADCIDSPSRMRPRFQIPRWWAFRRPESRRSPFLDLRSPESRA